MKKPGAVKEFANLFNKVFAAIIIEGGGNHPFILFEPGIVTGGKVELGQHFQPQIAAEFEFVAEFITTERIGQRNFRMALVSDTVRQIQHHGIHIAISDLPDQTAEYIFIEIIRQPGRKGAVFYIGLRRRHFRRGRAIFPAVVSELDKLDFHFFHIGILRDQINALPSQSGSAGKSIRFTTVGAISIMQLSQSMAPGVIP